MQASNALLLTLEEEKNLTKQYQLSVHLKDHVCKLQEELGRNVAYDELAKSLNIAEHYIDIILKKGEESKDILLRGNLRLVQHIVRNYGKRTALSGEEFSDERLFEEGKEGLIHAMKKFDWSKSFRFSTYSAWWIKQSISMALLDSNRASGVSVALADLINKVNFYRRDFFDAFQRYPTTFEVCEFLDITAEKLQEVMATQPLQIGTLDADVNSGATQKSTGGGYESGFSKSNMKGSLKVTSAKKMTSSSGGISDDDRERYEQLELLENSLEQKIHSSDFFSNSTNTAIGNRFTLSPEAFRFQQKAKRGRKSAKKDLETSSSSSSSNIPKTAEDVEDDPEDIMLAAAAEEEDSEEEEVEDEEESLLEEDDTEEREEEEDDDDDDDDGEEGEEEEEDDVVSELVEENVIVGDDDDISEDDGIDSDIDNDGEGESEGGEEDEGKGKRKKRIIQKRTRQSASQTATQPVMKFSDMMSSKDESMELVMLKKELLSDFESLLMKCGLEEKERFVIIHRAGFDDFGGAPRSLHELSNDLGMTREGIRRIEKKAQGKLKKQKSFFLGQVADIEKREAMLRHEYYGEDVSEGEFVVNEEFVNQYREDNGGSSGYEYD